MAENQDIRWMQRLSNYDKAVARLQNAAKIVSTEKQFSGEVDDLLKEGLVQRFEYTQELAWKVMKDYEEYQGYTDVQGSRDAIRKALQMGIIEDTAWMSTISSRNLTSHCYDEDEFNMVFNQIIHDYLPIFVKFSEKMNAIKVSDLLPYEFDFCIYKDLKNAELKSHITRRGVEVYDRSLRDI